VITIHQRHRQTDGQTDRRTDGRTSSDPMTATLLKHVAVIKRKQVILSRNQYVNYLRIKDCRLSVIGNNYCKLQSICPWHIQYRSSAFLSF